MLEGVLLLLAYLLPLSAGTAVVCFIDKKSSLGISERMALGFALGFGLLSLYMFFIGMIGLKYSVWTLAPYFLGGLALLYACRARIWPLTPASDGNAAFYSPHPAVKTIIYAVILALVAWKLFFVLYHTFSYPATFDDAVSTWNYKAKAIYYLGALRGPEASDIFGGYGAGYPLAVPLWRAWIAILTGTWNDAYVNLHNTVLFIFTALFFHASLRRLSGFFVASIFTYAFVSLPLITFHSLGGYADLPSACYLFMAITMTTRWFTTTNNENLFLAAPLGAVLMFIKVEGVVVYAPLLALIFVAYVILSQLPSRTKSRFVLALAVVITAAAAPWFVGKLLSGSDIATSLEFHTDAFAELFSVLFMEASFGVLWLAMALIPLLRPSGLRDRVFLAHALPALLFLAAILSIFIISSNYEWLYQRTTINRLLLVAAPLIIFSLGIFTGRNVLGNNSACLTRDKDNT